MKTSTLKSHFYFPSQSIIKYPTAKTLNLLPNINNTSYPKQPSNSFPTSSLARTATCSKQTARQTIISSHRNKSLILKPKPNIKKSVNDQFLQVSSSGYSRFVILGVVTIGIAMFLEGMDEQKALALGPDGPLMEEFWDNVRRYGLYALTVSSGALYTIFLPIFELLKNPISAILVLVLIGGSFYLVSQVVSAMTGISEFAYEFAY